MSAVPAFLSPPPAAPLPRAVPRPAPSRPSRERSPHTRMVQAALELFPGAVVVEHFPAPRPAAPDLEP